MTEVQHFGEHFRLDGYGGNPDLLNDKNVVLDCLTNLPEKLGMKKLADPVVYFAPGNGHKDPGGWSGVVVINESHISIHTFPMRGFISIDVYTCKNGLEMKYTQEYFIAQFQLQDTETNYVERGKKYPFANNSN